MAIPCKQETSSPQGIASPGLDTVENRHLLKPSIYALVVGLIISVIGIIPIALAAVPG